MTPPESQLYLLLSDTALMSPRVISGKLPRRFLACFFSTLPDLLIFFKGTFEAVLSAGDPVFRPVTLPALPLYVPSYMFEIRKTIQHLPLYTFQRIQYRHRTLLKTSIVFSCINGHKSVTFFPDGQILCKSVSQWFVFDRA